MAINALAAAFDKEIDESTLEAYWMSLDDMPIGAIEGAMRRSMRELEYFPRPAQLRRFEASLTSTQRSVVAWEAVRVAVSSRGAYASVDFDDPVTNATIRNMGGWRWLCEQPEKDFNVWVRKSFERIYNSLSSAGVLGESCRYLPGRTERDNIGTTPEVVRIPVGLPAPQLKVLGGKSGPDKTHHPGQAGQPEERQENSSFGRKDLHRFIKESFSVED